MEDFRWQWTIRFLSKDKLGYIRELEGLFEAPIIPRTGEICIIGNQKYRVDEVEHQFHETISPNTPHQEVNILVTVVM